KTILEVPGETGELQLLQNKPNPFENQTRIEFTLPEASMGKITITNTYGETVATFNGKFSAGLNYVDVNAEQMKLVPGVYYYTLEINGRKVTRKMVLLK
ncbi:MAG: T9SS type A sorting domain-containing protein, partial [Candidatus Kapaibacteriota bacterium]